MFCKIPPAYSSGTGNATVRIIALKNTSTTPRSQKFVVTSATGIARSITVNQEGAKISLPLEWVTLLPNKSYKKNEKSVSAILSLKNVLNAQFGKQIPNLKGDIYVVNGEEVSETCDITTWGFSLSSTITNVQTNADGGNTVTASINLNLDNPQAYAAAIGDTAYTEDEYGPYSSFTIEVGVQGIDGNYTYADWDITVYKEVLNSGGAAEITLNPESATISIEDYAVFTVNYDGIIPETIKFVPDYLIESQEGAIYLDSWTPLTGNEPASGSFDFNIATNSDATSNEYSFDITGKDVAGTTYTATGTLIVE